MTSTHISAFFGRHVTTPRRLQSPNKLQDRLQITEQVTGNDFDSQTATKTWLATLLLNQEPVHQGFPFIKTKYRINEGCGLYSLAT